MGEPETVIDLDLHPESRLADGWDVLDSHAQRTGPRTIAGWWRAARAGRAARWNRERWWLAAAMTFVVLLTAAGAATPPPPTLVEITVFNRTLETTWYSDGRLIVLEAGTISAYDPDSGAVLWTARHIGEFMGAEVAGPWLLINQPVDDPDEPGNLISGGIEARDLRTGQVRPERLHGWPRRFGDLLALHDDRGGKGPASSVLSFHDVRSLDLLWSRSVSTPLAWDVSRDGRTLYTLDAGGLLEEFDARTGNRLRSVALPMPKSDWMQLEVVGERLWLQGGNHPPLDSNEDVRILADLLLDRATMQLLPADGRRMEQSCGQLLCRAVEGPEALRVVVLDPATGTALWEVADNSTLAMSPAGLLRATGSSRHQLGHSTLLGLVDPRTGDIRVSVPAGWVLARDRMDTSSHRFLTAGRFVLSEPDLAQRPSFLGEITPFGLRQLGPLGFAAAQCESFAVYLLCQDVSGRSHLLRVNR